MLNLASVDCSKKQQSTLCTQDKFVEPNVYMAPEMLLDQIAHFFDHYKDLETGKWVRIDGWEDADEARTEILDSIARFERAPEKPNF